MKLTKTVSISPKNFGKQNTPPLIQKIGDIVLLAGVIGGAIVGLPAALSLALPVATANLIIASIPPIVFKIGGWGVAVGLIGKPITKLIGKTKEEDTPTQ